MPPGSGRQGDDAPASRTVQGRTLEVPLPADGADIAAVQGLGVHLSCQIDLDRGVDGEEAVESREHARAVNMVGPPHSEDGIAVRIAVEPGRAEQEAGRDKAGVGLPVPVGDGAALDEVHRRLVQQARVDCQVPFARQGLLNRCGNRADAEFQRRAIRHQPRHMPADGVLDRAGAAWNELFQRRGLRHQYVDVPVCDERVASGPG